MSDPTAAAAAVFRRRMFYIPGYDPFPPRRYRELYRREAALQAQVSGYRIALQPRSAPTGYGWRVTAEMPPDAADAGRAETDCEVLVWSGIVRTSMRQGILATYVQLLRTVWTYVASGAAWRLMRLRKGPVLAALYPIAMLTGQALVAVAVGLGMARMAVNPLVGPLAGAAAGLAAAGLVLWAFRRIDHRLYAYYLMHDYAFTASGQGAYPAAMEGQIAAFADRIAAALDQRVDEVLVVGHSSGAHVAVSVLADLFRAGRVPDAGPALALLTLGQVVPMVSFLPRAGRLRGDLACLSAQDRLFWLDITAPGDGCAFALCDPVAVSGIAPAGRRWPLVLSAAFSRTLSPERWRALRRRYFRLHFQYLCAFDRPDHYDYFRITAGPVPLASRYAGRASSPGRIEAPVSGHIATWGPP